MKKKFQIALIVLGGLLIFGFSAALLLKPKQDFSEAENRALQTMPELTADNVMSGDFQDNYETFLSDQFILRDVWVNIQTCLNRVIGEKDSNNVYFGNSGYLLEKYTYSSFIDDVEDGEELPASLLEDDSQVSMNLDALAEFLDYMYEEYGEEHLTCMFVPSKGTVLTNHLPAYAQEYDTSFLADYLDRRLSSPVNILDLANALKAHQDEYIYYKTDHHWTTLGAYYAYQTYLESLGEYAPVLTDYNINTVAKGFLGTTYDKVHVKSAGDTVTRFDNPEVSPVKVIYDDGTETDTCYYDEALEEKDKYLYFFNGNSSQIIMSGSLKNDKTIVVVKDSYANCFVPFLLAQYENVVMIDPRYVEESIPSMIEALYDEYNVTDILVMFNREKFMEDSSHMDYLYPEDGSDEGEGGSFDEGGDFDDGDGGSFDDGGSEDSDEEGIFDDGGSEDSDEEGIFDDGGSFDE